MVFSGAMKNRTLWIVAGAVGVGALVLLATRKASAGQPSKVPSNPDPDPACLAYLASIQAILVTMKPQLDACIASPGPENPACKAVSATIGPQLAIFKQRCGSTPGMPNLPGIPGLPGFPSTPGIPQPPVLPAGPSPECQANALALASVFTDNATLARSCTLSPSLENQDCVLLYQKAAAAAKKVKDSCGVTPALPSWLPIPPGLSGLGTYRMT